MARNKDDDVIKSSLIIAEVQKRPILYDTNHQAYGERSTKSQCWEEVCAAVVPTWGSMAAAEKCASGKEIQKRWRSIRDSYTKQYRAGRCAPPGLLAGAGGGGGGSGGGRRAQHQRQMAFLYALLEKKASRVSTEKRNSETDTAASQNNSQITIKQETEEPKNSKQAKPSTVKAIPANDIKSIMLDKKALNIASSVKPVKLPEVDISENKNIETKKLGAKTMKSDQAHKSQKKTKEPQANETNATAKTDDKETQSDLSNSREDDEVSLSYLRNSKRNKEQIQPPVQNTHLNKDVFLQPPFINANVETVRTTTEINNMNPSVEINIGTNTVLPDDYFNDDKLFMNSLLPFFRKMDDDTRLTCRIEVLKIIQRALQTQMVKLPEEITVKEESKESSEERDVTKNAAKSSQTSALRMCRKRKPEEVSETPEQPPRRRGRPRKTCTPMELMTADWLVYDPEEASRRREERARRRLLRMDRDEIKDESDCSERSSVWGRPGARDERQARAQRARAREDTRARDDDDEEMSRATSVTQLRAENFLKMYNLEPAKKPLTTNSQPSAPEKV